MKLYNSLANTKQTFKPINPNKVGIYVCGMTVYDYCHIGHGRMFVVFDAFIRFLRAKGLEVNYVRNITDIDDKIIKRAQENGETIDQLTERTIASMHEDEISLGCLAPNHEPRATQYIEQMLDMIQGLVNQGYAYVAGNGDVCYRVEKFDGYGKLSNRKLKDLEAGARIDINEGKENPLDFVLWKLSKPGEPSWPSPWGEGRPGWHIECSAMSKELLGLPFDIHGGGIDLLFPHHENEIAQSEVACGCQLSNYWMHNGHVQVNDEKMSKSLGNFLTIRDAVKQFDPEAVRYFLLSAHYRSPVNFSVDTVTNAHAALTRYYTALRDLDISNEYVQTEFSARFMAALEDDFNVPLALSVLFELVSEVNRQREAKELEQANQFASELVALAAILGIGQSDPVSFLQGDVADDQVAKIEALIAERTQARADKNWQRSDEIRDELAAMGIQIEDSAGGTTWKKA